VATVTVTVYATPTSSVAPLPPVTHSTDVAVSWSGTDAGGSGIAAYTIYVSTDGGPFATWLTDTTATSATFTGAYGHSYGFVSVATDRDGLAQAMPAAAQASTTLKSPEGPPPGTKHTASTPLVTIKGVSLLKLGAGRHRTQQVIVLFIGGTLDAESADNPGNYTLGRWPGAGSAARSWRSPASITTPGRTP
jgi:hypothetical protein